MYYFKDKIVCFLLVVINQLLFAQQINQNGLYVSDMIFVNPAYTGSQGLLSASLLYKTQWLGREGALKTQGVGVHAPIKNKKIGFGLLIANNQIGVVNSKSISGFYAYHIPLENGQISLGIQGELNQVSLDYGILNLYDLDDNSFINTRSEILTDAHIGGLYQNRNSYFGVSIYNLIQSNVVSEEGEIQKDFIRKYSIMGGLKKRLNEDIQIAPSVFVNYIRPNKFYTDLASSFIFNEKIIAGLSYRTTNAIIITAQMLWNDLRVGYSMDYFIDSKLKGNAVSHEILVNYQISLFKKKLISPR